MNYPPIIICSVTGKCLPVLMTSIVEYVPRKVTVYLSQRDDTRRRYMVKPNTRYYNNEGTTFGESYNKIVDAAFADGHESVIIANDDVILNPLSWQMMMGDVEALQGTKVGWVAARADYARKCQNMIFITEGGRFKENMVSPYFAWISKEAWRHGRFPPITYFSDDLSSRQLTDEGYQNWVSACYVHHVGAQTAKENSDIHIPESVEWIRTNRPDLHSEWKLK
jgi:hypothetical protein